MTNISVGRGTDTPFEVFGAPWVNARQLANALNGAGLTGVRFVPIRFTPRSSKFEGTLCDGVHVIITDRAAFEPLEAGLTIAHHLRTLYPNDWEMKNYNRLLCNDAVWHAIVDNQPLEKVLELSRHGVIDFVTSRDRFLLY
jgi:uncharacterized protein YbbC (DUF1343 family)